MDVAAQLGDLSLNDTAQRKSPDTMPEIFVKTLTGKTLQIKIPLTATVEEFKQAVYTLEGIPVEQQRHIYAGKQLEDGRTLAECGVVNMTTTHLVMRLRGGGISLTTTDMSDMSKHSFTDEPLPDWRGVGHGLSLEIKCKNRLCATREYRYRSYKRLRFGTFNLLDVMHEMICPCCDSSDVELSTFGFYKCNYKIAYEVEESVNGVIEIKAHTRKASVDASGFYKFNDSDNGSAVYRKLMVQTWAEGVKVVEAEF